MNKHAKYTKTDMLLITNGGSSLRGLFSYVAQVIGNLHVADLQQRAMYVKIPSSPYWNPLKGNNCWDYYFKQPYEIDENYFSLFNTQFEAEWFGGRLNTIAPDLNSDVISRAKELTKKYIAPKDFIRCKIDQFKLTQIQTNDYAAIHFRGTDHYRGAIEQSMPIIPQAIYHQYIEQLLKSFSKVLICSDQQDFITNTIQQFGNSVIYYPSIRSSDEHDQAIHYNEKIIDKYSAGEDVVIESYLMSESKYLARTCSGVTNFSIWNNQDPEFKFINIDELYYGQTHSKRKIRIN